VSSIDEIRQLIQISPNDERYLRKHFDEAKVTEVIRFREEVLRRFEQLLSSQTPIIERTKPKPKRRRSNGWHCRKAAETGWRQSGGIRPDQIPRIIAMRAEDFSREAIGRRFGVSSMTIARTLDKMRPSSDG
jgi:hypothetical protein